MKAYHQCMYVGDGVEVCMHPKLVSIPMLIILCACACECVHFHF